MPKSKWSSKIFSRSWLHVLPLLPLFVTANYARAGDPLTAAGSAIPLPNGVKSVVLEGLWEERPMHSDFVAGDTSLSIPRFSLLMGMGDWAEVTITYDILQNLVDGPRSLIGGGSPRLIQKFRFFEQEGLRPSLGGRVGFKWPAANEPFEVDSGDFAVALLASWRFEGGWAIDLNSGPAIFGDRVRADAQNHTWVWNLSVARAWERLGLTLRQEVLEDAQLAEQWYVFWASEAGPFNRLELATSLAWTFNPSTTLTARYERSLIDTGVRQGFGVGMEWTF